MIADRIALAHCAHFSLHCEMQPQKRRRSLAVRTDANNVVSAYFTCAGRLNLTQSLPVVGLKCFLQ